MYLIGSILETPYPMHNEALVASYATQVSHTICQELSPSGYATAGPPLAPILLEFDTRRRSRKTVNFRIPSSLPTETVLVPREGGRHLPGNPSWLLLLRSRRLALLNFVFCYPASGIVD